MLSVAHATETLTTANTENMENTGVYCTRHQYTLDNGLKVIIKEDHRSPVVMTQIWYKVGSSDEPKNTGGISHLLEHMMFKGTDKVSGDEFEELVAKYGGVNNAFTSYDYTGYYE
ncbi:MAG: peptidase M16, partial [Pseudomonadales bacterium]